MITYESMNSEIILIFDDFFLFVNLSYMEDYFQVRYIPYIYHYYAYNTTMHYHEVNKPCHTIYYLSYNIQHELKLKTNIN